MGLLAHQMFMKRALWRRHFCLLRRDSSRRLGNIDTSVDAARKSACATTSVFNGAGTFIRTARPTTDPPA
jgi:hypothetical protein